MCPFVCVRMKPTKKKLSLIAQVHLLTPKQASNSQTQTTQTKNRKKCKYRQHTCHKFLPQSSQLRPRTICAFFFGSCVDGVDWHGLQYGLYCFRTKASQLKAKVKWKNNKPVFMGKRGESMGRVCLYISMDANLTTFRDFETKNGKAFAL